MPAPSLVRPERSAHAAIRGYLYQTCLGVVRLPEAFAGWMRIMVDNYQQRADEAGRPVDGELLGPILAGLERVGAAG